MCPNTPSTTPNKIFCYTPHDKIRRDKWLNLAGRDSREFATTSRIYFCEDHFDVRFALLTPLFQVVFI